MTGEKINPKLEFFLSLLSNEDEKIILKLIYQKMNREKIVESLINYKPVNSKKNK
jgi:hypothetical protein|tara:strand:- start:3276 stop:3440 length:165 start_codon:yes stop_codon:yes gene_type:complete